MKKLIKPKMLEYIKIQNENKIFRIQKQDSLIALKSSLQTRFYIENLKNYDILYKDNNKEDITIENEEDFKISINQKIEDFKILIKEKKEKKENIDIIRNLENNLCNFSESFEKIIQKNEIPCENCFFEKKNFICLKCKNKKKKKMGKKWKMIFLLIDYKIKNLILDPLKEILGIFKNKNYDSNKNGNFQDNLIDYKKNSYFFKKHSYEYFKNNFYDFKKHSYDYYKKVFGNQIIKKKNEKPKKKCENYSFFKKGSNNHFIRKNLKTKKIIFKKDSLSDNIYEEKESSVFNKNLKHYNNLKNQKKLNFKEEQRKKKEFEKKIFFDKKLNKKYSSNEKNENENSFSNSKKTIKKNDIKEKLKKEFSPQIQNLSQFHKLSNRKKKIFEENHFFKKKKLNFQIQESQIEIISTNKLLITIIIDNRTNFDWPKEIIIKGDKNCKLTEFFYKELKCNIKALSVDSLKFEIDTIYNTNIINFQPLVFVINCFDWENAVKYFSKSFEVFKKDEKDSFLSMVI